MSADPLIDRLRSMRDGLAGRGVAHLALFGSRARGDARPDSDVDLLVDVIPGRKFSLIDLLGVEQELAEHTGLPVSLVMRRSLDPDFRASIAADVIEIF